MTLEINHEALSKLTEGAVRASARKAADASDSRAHLAASGVALEVGLVGMRDEYGADEYPARPWVMHMLEGLDGGS